MEAALTQFSSTYVALLKTLCDKHPHTSLATRLQVFENAGSSKVVSETCLKWYEDLTDHKKLIVTRKDTLWDQNIGVFEEIYLNELIHRKKFTANSKKYLFMYVASLFKTATAYHAAFQESQQTDDAKVIEAVDTSNDIAPPILDSSSSFEDMVGGPALAPFLKCIPPEMLNKVKKIAEKHGEKAVNSEKSGKGKGIEGLNFNEISEEIFSEMDGNDMKNLMQGVGTMLNGLMQMTDGMNGGVNDVD